MANPNPPTEQLKGTQFKPGQSGNPGGMTKEQKALIVKNAEQATRIREKLLARLEVDIDEGRELDSETLRMLKDAEDRGYGAPKQDMSVEATTIVRKTVYEREPD